MFPFRVYPVPWTVLSQSSMISASAGFFRRFASATNSNGSIEQSIRSRCRNAIRPMGGNGQLAPAALVIQDRVQVRCVGGIEDGPMPPMDAQLEGLVALEHEGGLRIAPRSHDRRHLPAAELEAALEALHVDPAVSPRPGGKPEEQLAVHLGEAVKPGPPEQVVGVEE